ncbi:hypothetical protein LTR96_006478 [Exophiala xenobiotica]|nr:hypothetical protein LTR96_006478 [Exophiala xenobiotica]KAK5335669.1 hypothetical protein LTR98_007883 [Exophiala xenobiotica]KAK5438350.1 hypothetical protein LTR18_008872 [Exophiala xenobiotica]KAK5557286.1 hypothetical protein LTR46_004312 [Exophiala xenobiotica]
MCNPFFFVLMWFVVALQATNITVASISCNVSSMVTETVFTTLHVTSIVPITITMSPVPASSLVAPFQNTTTCTKGENKTVTVANPSIVSSTLTSLRTAFTTVTFDNQTTEHASATEVGPTSTGSVDNTMWTTTTVFTTVTSDNEITEHGAATEVLPTLTGSLDNNMTTTTTLFTTEQTTSTLVLTNLTSTETESQISESTSVEFTTLASIPNNLNLSLAFTPLPTVTALLPIPTPEGPFSVPSSLSPPHLTPLGTDNFNFSSTSIQASTATDLVPLTTGSTTITTTVTVANTAITGASTATDLVPLNTGSTTTTTVTVVDSSAITGTSIAIAIGTGTVTGTGTGLTNETSILNSTFTFAASTLTPTIPSFTTSNSNSTSVLATQSLNAAGSVRAPGSFKYAVHLLTLLRGVAAHARIAEGPVLSSSSSTSSTSSCSSGKPSSSSDTTTTLVNTTTSSTTTVTATLTALTTLPVIINTTVPSASASVSSANATITVPFNFNTMAPPMVTVTGTGNQHIPDSDKTQELTGGFTALWPNTSAPTRTPSLTSTSTVVVTPTPTPHSDVSMVIDTTTQHISTTTVTGGIPSRAGVAKITPPKGLIYATASCLFMLAVGAWIVL